MEGQGFTLIELVIGLFVITVIILILLGMLMAKGCPMEERLASGDFGDVSSFLSGEEHTFQRNLTV